MNIMGLVRGILVQIGEDPNREGLAETPHRVNEAWKEWTEGYRTDPDSLVKTFDDGVEVYAGLVSVSVPFYSHCEHHLAPFFGTVTVSYWPNGKIIGLSKIQRIVDMYSRRLQVQERMTQQIARFMIDRVQCRHVIVQCSARHLCMESRGICKPGITTSTKVELSQ